MNKELYHLVRNALIDNLEPGEGLSEVIMGGLSEKLTTEQIEECQTILDSLLIITKSFVSGQTPISGLDGMN